MSGWRLEMSRTLISRADHDRLLVKEPAFLAMLKRTYSPSWSLAGCTLYNVDQSAKARLADFGVQS